MSLEQFHTLETRMAALEARMAALENRMAVLEARMTKMMDLLRGIAIRLGVEGAH